MGKEKHRKGDKSKSSKKSNKKEGKKDKKHSKKQKQNKKEKVARIADPVDPARVSESINEDDFFRLSEEFRVWLKMAKNKYVATFPFYVFVDHESPVVADHLKKCYLQMPVNISEIL